MTDVSGGVERKGNLITGADFTPRKFKLPDEPEGDALDLSTAERIDHLGTTTDQIDGAGGLGESELTDRESPSNEKLKLLDKDSVPGLEGVVRRLEPRLAPDQERLEVATSALEKAIALFDNYSDDDPQDRAGHAFRLQQLDPDDTFIQAYADYTAAAIAMFRDLHPKSREGSITFFEAVVAKMAKREARYGGPVPAIMKEMGIDAEPAFEEARRRHDALDESTRQAGLLQSAAEISLMRSVGELGEESTAFYDKTGRPFPGVLIQIRAEIQELRDELEKVSINDLLARLKERRPETSVQDWRLRLRKLSAAEIVDAEKSGDPLYALAGELADIFIAGLDIANSFRPKASKAIIKSIYSVIREDSGRERPPDDEMGWEIKFPVDRIREKMAPAIGSGRSE